MARKKKQGDPKRAVAYLRTSTDEQNNGLSAQRDLIEKWAKREGVEVVAWHEEHVSGGAQPDARPGLLDALENLREHEAGILVAAKRDRIARDVVVSATIEMLVKGAGATVVTADGITADDTPEGQLMRTLMDAFAAYERSVIKARTRAALQARKARGLRHSGRAPFGFRHEGDKLVPVELEQEQVERIRLLREEGLSVAAIVRRFEGEPCRGSRWHPTTVRRVLARAA